MTGALFLLLSTFCGAIAAAACLTRTNGRLLPLAFGPVLGAGTSSLVFFLLNWSGLASPASVWASQASLMAAALLLLRMRWRLAERMETAAPAANLVTWVLRGAVALSVLLLVMDIAATTEGTPDGDWDAFAIWNMRARFLAAGPSAWREAMTPGVNAGLTGASHPGYPLLVSGWIGMAWMVNGAADPAVAAWAGAFFSLSAVALLFAALRRLCGEWSALLAVLVLLATEAFRSQAASQCADIPLSLCVLGATACAAIALRQDDPGAWLLAGFCTGLAPWTKNEGWPFALAAAALVLFVAARSAPLFLAGVVPPAAITLLFKSLVPPGTESAFPSSAAEAFARLGDPGRWGVVIGSYAKQIWEMGFPLQHPLLLLALLAWALRPAPHERRKRTFVLAWPPLALGAASFALLLVTSADIAWHTSTSVARLIIQPWPAFLLIAFCLLRKPEESLPMAVADMRAPAEPQDPPAVRPRRQPARRAKG